MPYPHDYYHDYEPHPELHNRGEDRPYLEPDYYGHGMRGRLPALSAIGRGPRGEGLVVVPREDCYGFRLLSSLTGEELWTSPNMDPPVITIDSKQNVMDIPYGVHNPMEISIVQGGVTTKKNVYIPSGTRGSMVFLLGMTLTRARRKYPKARDDTYEVQIRDLTAYGLSAYAKSRPNPRPNDIVFFAYNDNGTSGFGFGTIENVGGFVQDMPGQDPLPAETNVVFTARTFVPMPDITVGQNGHWFVNDEDTGVDATGPQGPKGDKGDKGEDGRSIIGPKGPKGDPGDDADIRVVETVQLRPGQSAYVQDLDQSSSRSRLKFGIPEGLPATISEITIQTGDAGTDATVAKRVISERNNQYGIDFTIPRGEDGAPLDFQNGVYRIEDLPPYTPTPINRAFIVDDGDGTYDLYIRGRIPIDAEDGGPWVVIEDWGYPHINIATEAEVSAIIARVISERS